MRKIIFWCLMIGATYLMTIWAKANPIWIDDFYLPYIYTNLNKVLFFIFDRFSFSIGDILYALAVLLLLRKIVTIFRQKQKIITHLTTVIVQFLAVFYFWFNLSWGLCNYRTPLHKSLEIPTQYTLADLQHETQRLINQVNQLQQAIGFGNESTNIDRDLTDFSENAKIGYHNIQPITHFSVKNISDVKPSIYSKALSKMGFGGYFNPFTHENQVNTEVPAISLCVTSAHEIAHQLGYASESEANFLGYLALLNQDKLSYQYAANLFALRYCLREIYRNDNDNIDFFLNQINEGSRKDISIVEKFWQSNKNITADWSNKFYGQFLKLNNQKEGMRSYQQFVNLLIGYHQKMILENNSTIYQSHLQ